MVAVKTLVYFDLEATGLKSSGKPRITELCLVAVNISDITELNKKIVEHIENKSVAKKNKVEHLVPRVMNKLTLCVYPMATILPTASHITGLDNYNLSGQATFDKNTGDLLNSFLARLPPPVCLVAHNGDMYDYPLLKAELNKAVCELGPSILCADSYVGIKEIFRKRAERDRSKEVERKIVEKEIEVMIELLNAGEFETDMDIVRKPKSLENPCTPVKVLRKRSSQDLVNSPEILHQLKVPRKENESTPVRRDNFERENVGIRKLKQPSCSEIFKPRKKLFDNPTTPPSFSLINLHKYLLGFPPSQSHGAEADCLALLRTTAVLGKEWLDWVEENCYVFNDCKEMWVMGGQI